MQTSSPTLYDLLNISKDCSKEEIRKAYKVLALKIHPDKNSDPNAHENFQDINKAYNILIDDEKRNIYDMYGEIDGDFIDVNKIYNYYKNVYPKITLEDINQYEEKYIDSEEERQDIMNFYILKKGNVEKILEYIPFSKNEYINRYLGIIDNMIINKQIKKFKDFDLTKNKITLLVKSKKEVKKAEQVKSSMEELQAAILKKKHKMINLPYSKEHEDIDEEEFMKIKNKLEKRKNK